MLAPQAGTIPCKKRLEAHDSLTLPDLAAFAWFLGAWIVYSIVIERDSIAI